MTKYAVLSIVSVSSYNRHTPSERCLLWSVHLLSLWVRVLNFRSASLVCFDPLSALYVSMQGGAVLFNCRD